MRSLCKLFHAQPLSHALAATKGFSSTSLFAPATRLVRQCGSHALLPCSPLRKLRCCCSHFDVRQAGLYSLQAGAPLLWRGRLGGRF